MAKTCPSCGYNPIGPFTDNCPICAEPVRNVRSGPRGGGSAWSLPWVRWVMGAAVAGVLGVAGCCGFGSWRMGSAIQDAQKMMEEAKAKHEADRKARTVAVKAADLLEEFENDPAAADRKYQGKCLEIAGVVERVGKVGGTGAPFVILHAGDEWSQLKIECFFDYVDPNDKTRNPNFDKGQAVTLCGEYGGRVSHVQVRSCMVVR